MDDSGDERITWPASTLDRPVDVDLVEQVADDAARRVRLRRRAQALAPALVALGGFLLLVAVLIAAGELITRTGLLAGVRHWDDQVNQTLADHRTPWMDRLSTIGSKSAETAPIVIGALIVEIVLVVRRRWRDLLLVSIGLAVELATFLAVNEIVRRERPSVDKLGIVPGTFSFPSGHTAATIVLYGSIVLLLTLHLRSRLVRVAAWVPVLLVTVVVGWARVYRGMHHVTDVAIGAVMGVGCLFIAVTAARASSIAANPTRTAVAPGPATATLSTTAAAEVPTHEEQVPA